MSHEMEISNAEEYSQLIEVAEGLLSGLKVLDYEALKSELRVLNFPLSENPSLQQLNLEIQKIQEYKDRVTEILMDATSDFIMKERIAKILVDGWQKFSKESAQDKRKSDSITRFAKYILMSAEAESFFKTTYHVLKNLEGKHEAASRRLTCFNLSLKLRDINRGTPDRDYHTFYRDNGPDYAKDDDDDFAESITGGQEKDDEKDDEKTQF